MPDQQRAGLYGLDLYSLFSSIEAVVRYLDNVDAPAAARARARYACFDDFGEDPQVYGYAATAGLEEAAKTKSSRSWSSFRSGGGLCEPRRASCEDEQFFAEQNARLAMNAEAYYRSMFRGRVSSWNLRDQHMVDTLDALMQHLAAAGRIRRSWSGRTTRTLVMPAPPRWAGAAS